MSSTARKMGLLETHFGTDMLVGAWLLLLSALIPFFVLMYYLCDALANDTYNDVKICYYATNTVVMVLFSLGSVIMVRMSYPDEYDIMMNEVAHLDLKKLTFIQRYFTATWILELTWFFFGAFLVFLVYPIYAMCVGSYTLSVGIAYVVVLVIISLPMLLWVVACFPENMLKNSGMGSTIVHDNLCCCKGCINFFARVVCCGRGDSDFVEHHFGSDFFAGVWILVFYAVFSCIFSFLLLLWEPGQPINWWLFFTSIFFLIGMYLFAVSSYPGYERENSVYRFFTGQKSSSGYRRRNIGDDCTAPTEESPLFA